jgi:hypothetical protein
MNPWLKLALMLAMFATQTALGVWWAVPDRELRDMLARSIASLGPRSAILACAIAIGLIAAEMLRLVVFAHVLGVRVGSRAAFESTIANWLLSWISPGGLLGEPAGIYMLARHRIAWDAATAMSFGKFATSFIFIMGLGTALLAAGYGPAIPPWALVSASVTAGLGVVLGGGLLLGVFWPAALKHVLGFDFAHRAIERLARLRHVGIRGWLAIVACHVVYYAAYVGLIVALAAMLGAPVPLAATPVAVVYLAFTFIAPAPGLAELSAGAFFGALMPGGEAITVVVLFRTLTAYLHVAIALVYLPIVGSLRAILDTRRSRTRA